MINQLLVALVALCVVMAAGLVYLYVRYRRLSFKHNIRLTALNASVGGYYFFDAVKDSGFFSINLVSLFHLPPNITSVKQFCMEVGDHKHTLLHHVESLVNQETPQFSYNMAVKLRGREADVYCVGTRMHKNNGELIGVIVWFYDMTYFNQQVDRILTEQKIYQQRASELETLAETLPFPVWMTNRQGKITYRNKVYASFVQGDNNDNLYHSMPQDISACFQAAAPLHSTQQIVVEGNRGIYNVSLLPVKNNLQAVGWAYDVTQQQKLNNEIQKYASAYRDLLESSSSAMAMYGVNTQLQFYNHAFASLWGLSQQWLDSKPTYAEVLEKLREKRKLPEQVDFKQFRDTQLRWFQELSETHNEFYYLPDGTELRVIVVPHALGGILFAYEDITDRLAMERSYNTLVAVQKETLDNLKEGVAVFNESGRLELYNPAYTALWPHEATFLKQMPHITELVEQMKSMIVYQGSWQSFKNTMIAEATHRQSVARRFESTDGKVVDVLTIPLPDGKNLLSYMDITDTILAEKSLVQRNAALEEADRIKTEFLANVSYELRTPLTTILGFSEMLETFYKDDKDVSQVEYLAGIHESANHLMSLINNILDLASIEAGYLALEIKPFNLYDAASAMIDVLHTRIQEAGLEVKLSGSHKNSVINGDEKRIKQVIFNLMSNALKFTDMGGNIAITIRNAKKHITLSVVDTGVGIEQDEIPFIFNRFYKTRTAKSLDKPGTGLGLSLVKNIVEMHHGSVDVESEPDKGTKVVIDLPK